MRIYVGHSSSFDYVKELYQPLKSAKFWRNYTFILPHDTQVGVTHSKSIISNCDLMLAEVSYPSTGLGIELGWAYEADCRIACIYREGASLSSALNLLCADFIEYTDANNMITILPDYLELVASCQTS